MRVAEERWWFRSPQSQDGEEFSIDNYFEFKQEHKDGNDGTDEAAYIGVKQHGTGLLDLSIFFAAKLSEYGQFMGEALK